MGIHKGRNHSQRLNSIAGPTRTDIRHNSGRNRQAAVFFRSLTGIQQPAYTDPTGLSGIFEQVRGINRSRHGECRVSGVGGRGSGVVRIIQPLNNGMQRFTNEWTCVPSAADGETRLPHNPVMAA